MDDKHSADVVTAEPAPVGATAQPGSSIPPEQLEQLTADIVAALKTVYDPEIPADIYELGLIYKIDVDDERNIAIEMTLDVARAARSPARCRPGSRTRSPPCPASGRSA